ncbi:MAG: hypothetical protein IPP97_10895 [Candidatus Obscuribacter sp.]|nr:hypothetical protein [Candidatus Obscuribacter sp.]
MARARVQQLVKTTASVKALASAPTAKSLTPPALMQPALMQPVLMQKRWLVAGSQSPTLLRDNLDELVVEPGDSYWSLAKLVVSIRTGRIATSAEVKAMVKEMAHFNGKTQCEATKIMVGDVIKVPPEKPKA